MDNNDEGLYINGLRDKVMERLEHFREYSAVMLKFAIESYEYRGPLFPDNSSSLEAFLQAMQDIARSLSDWIRIMETEQVVALEDVPRAVEATPEVVPLYKRVARCLGGYKDGRIWPLNFFYEAIELATELFDEIKESGKYMMVICPSLQTSLEIIELHAIVDEALKRIDENFVEQEQFALKEEERRALRHSRQIKGKQGSRG